ncbi:MAG: hypothetical protein ACI8Y7_000110 [Candidatus Woesearchaeota archaeon]|jgi:hypothetical protein
MGVLIWIIGIILLLLALSIIFKILKFTVKIVSLVLILALIGGGFYLFGSTQLLIPQALHILNDTSDTMRYVAVSNETQEAIFVTDPDISLYSVIFTHKYLEISCLEDDVELVYEECIKKRILNATMLAKLLANDSVSISKSK